MNAKGQKGFSVTNVVLGVILTLSGTIMLFDNTTYPGPFIALPLGIIWWISGASMMKKLRGNKADIGKGSLVFNKVCFIIACVLFSMVIILPLINAIFY